VSGPAAARSGADVRAVYDDLYGRGEMSLSRNYSDKFPLLEHVLAPEVKGRAVLDFGCGPGRLSLMLARHARHVHGVDYAAAGVEMATLLARVASVDNATFACGDLAAVLADARRWDVIVLAGVLEHLEQPREQLAALAGRLTAGGLLCLQTPSFANFRGDVYNTLGTLLALPMSLTDLWQVTPRTMRDIAAAIGVDLERVVGGHYRFAFLDRVLEDFRDRVPAAARDAGQGVDWRWERFFDWIAERVEQNRALLDAWAAQGALKPVPAPPPLSAARPAGLDDRLWSALETYLTYDGWREPWYSDVPPVCHYGASAVYLLRKAGG
jgi:2-polyprenyl-3-methyl-5-hydroxy-6-metoxy-1,4-benzoquinol methylase